MPRDMGTARTPLQLALQITWIFTCWLFVFREPVRDVWRGHWPSSGPFMVTSLALSALLIGIQWYRYRTQKSAEQVFLPLTRGKALLVVPTIMFGFMAGIFWFTGLRPLIAIPLLGWLYAAGRIWWDQSGRSA